MQATVREVEARLGRVDVLVNNVDWTMDLLFVEKAREEWEKEIQLNLWGMINCTRAVLEPLPVLPLSELYPAAVADMLVSATRRLKPPSPLC